MAIRGTEVRGDYPMSYPMSLDGARGGEIPRSGPRSGSEGERRDDKTEPAETQEREPIKGGGRAENQEHHEVGIKGGAGGGG